VRRIDGPAQAERQANLVDEVDAGLPEATRTTIGVPDEVGPGGALWVDGEPPGRSPFIADSFLRAEVGRILARHSSSFSADWHADPERLRIEAVRLLDRFGLVTIVPGGVVVLPLTGRYRNTVAVSRPRASAGLF
jgi:hypothetical protein